MANHLIIQSGLLVLIYQYFIVLTNAQLSSREARTLNLKLELINSDIQNKLITALSEIQELRENSVSCECKQQTDRERNLFEPEQSTTTEIVKNDKESSSTDIARLFKAFANEKHDRKKTEHFLRNKIKVHQNEIIQLKKNLIEMNATIDKLTKGTEDIQSTITSQHGKIHNLSTILETRNLAIPVCEIPPSIKYGNVDYSSGTMVGAMATYTCNDGFSVQGEKKRTCLPSRQWKSDEPLCIRAKGCSTPSLLLHGHVDYTSTRVGSKATYICDVGFARDGLTERKCLPTAEWEGETPVCVKVCTTPSPLLHGHVVYTTTRVGSKATYSCDVGFARDGLTERICLPTAEWEGETPVCVQDPVQNCNDILVAGLSTGDGLYNITFNDNEKPIVKEVYCDMTTDNGGWTVFQYRYDGSVDFYRVYHEYTEGFGRYPGEFWLGLKWIHALTTRGQYMLRVDLTGKDPSGDGLVTGFAKYTNFSIGPAAGSYMLHVDGYLQNSTIIDKLTYHNGRGFTTKDHDVDRASGNCAVRHHGAWWYGACYDSNLNGLYLEPGVDDITSMNWYRWPTGEFTSLVASQLSFKPV